PSPANAGEGRVGAHTRPGFSRRENPSPACGGGQVGDLSAARCWPRRRAAAACCLEPQRHRATEGHRDGGFGWERRWTQMNADERRYGFSARLRRANLPICVHPSLSASICVQLPSLCLCASVVQGSRLQLPPPLAPPYGSTSSAHGVCATNVLCAAT